MTAPRSFEIHLLESLTGAQREAVRAVIEAEVELAHRRAAAGSGDLWALSWSNQMVKDELKVAKTLVALDKKSAELKGFLFFRPPGSVWEITLVMTLPSFRGHKVGETMIDALMSHIASNSTISLEVRADNTAAVGLYRKCGFLEQGRRLRYYRDGMDAIIMNSQSRVSPR